MYYQTHFKKTYLCILSLFLTLLTVLSVPDRAGEKTAVSAQGGGNGVTVLMYHSVCASNKRNSEYVLTPEKFRADMEYLLDHGCEFVTMARIYNCYRGRETLPEKAVAVTLDDGFLNNLTCVLPVLKELGIHANINIVGSFTEKYSSLRDRSDSYACLTWEDIDALKNSGLIEIGSHTWDMHSLGTRRGCAAKRGETPEDYRAALRNDVRKLNTALRKNCGLSPFVFAYPYGEISPGAKEVLYEEGFRVLLTCEEKVNEITPDGGDLLTLGRFNRPSFLTTEEFMKKIGQ